jgi:nitroreductase
MELQEVVRTAGSCRFFLPDPVPDEVLAKLLDAARFAPQGGNRQPLSARELGLGAALTTLLCAYEPQVKELLGIPDGVAVAGVIALGWPARPLHKKLTRRPLSEVVFAERYGEPLLAGD